MVAAGPGPRPGSAFRRLTEFLAGQVISTVPLTFQQVEDIMADALPLSAKTSIPYWSNTAAALGKAIMAGGYRPTNVDLWNERVILARLAPAPTDMVIAVVSTPSRRRPRPQRRAAANLPPGLDQ